MNRPALSDGPGRHGLNILQPVRGYRYSIDALLLADFVRLPDRAEVADLGTGCGVIPLVLARRMSSAVFVGIESNPEMAGMALENAAANGFAGRIGIVSDDVLRVRARFPVSSFDVVVSNPPFRSPESGKLSPHPGRDTARHESSAGIADFLSSAKYLVRPSGRIYFIYHPSRLDEFLAEARGLKLSLLRLRMVHGRPDGPATMFLAELAKGRRARPVVLPPLIVRDAEGEYSAEVAGLTG